MNASKVTWDVGLVEPVEVVESLKHISHFNYSQTIGWLSWAAHYMTAAGYLVRSLCGVPIFQASWLQNFVCLIAGIWVRDDRATLPASLYPLDSCMIQG